MKTTEQDKLSGVASAITAQSAVESNKKATTTTINIGFTLSGVAVVGVGLTAFYFLYWKNRFHPMKYNQYAANSNVSLAAVVIKANALYGATKGKDTDGKAVKNALRSISYSGYVDVYNVSGRREPGGLSFSLGNDNYEDLIGFLHDDLNDRELQDLRRTMVLDAAILI